MDLESGFAALADVSGESRLQRLGRAAARVVQATLARADQGQGEIGAPDPQPVPMWQWSLPVALALALWAAAQAWAR